MARQLNWMRPNRGRCFLYVVLRVDISREWTRGGDESHSFKVYMYLLPPVFTDSEYFSPRFRVEVTNRGPDIERFSYEVFVGYPENPRDFPGMSSPLLDVYHSPITRLVENAVDVKAFSVPVHSLKVGTMLLGIQSQEWIPSPSIREMTEERVGQYALTEEQRLAIIEHDLNLFRKHSKIDIDYKNPNSFTGKRLQNFRVLYPIKIRDFASASTIYLAIFITVLGSVAYGVFKTVMFFLAD